MEVKTRTGANNYLYYYEDGKLVYPCRCGETHGEFYDWAHHECHHNVVWVHDQMDGIGYCVECGKPIKLVE